MYLLLVSKSISLGSETVIKFKFKSEVNVSVIIIFKHMSSLVHTVTFVILLSARFYTQPIQNWTLQVKMNYISIQ